ncbi:lytic polysaccharide monooxygenase auxiliary activity family 9 protein [Phytohabitans houttuyneae]|uniref:lytic polysaccharide monooxygenase auxiliary activity family 9 protein n=1 Tax=Phytohabitans houttuyneae TaxID=1076126 RepID=UPI001565449B|nr:lytic polysaccharide monooxygenase [Phytohabitans houttuyneae]
MKARRRLAVLAAAALLGSGVPLLLKPSPVEAHGAFVSPATRTYACYVDGRANGGGDLNPTNPACVAAVAAGGKQPLWDFFGLLQSNAAGQHRTIIPDGQLCGGGTTKYAAYNAARTDWPTTQVQSGGTMQFRYNAWAPHPGTWYQYITRDGYDPTQPLKWSDLEATPFDQVTNPPTQGGPSGSEYYWDARLPSKQGRHIIYSIWQRSDSPEAFYNCVDVNFGGTNPTSPPPTSPPPTSAPPTSAPPTSPPPSTSGPATCTATVRTSSQWSGGFQGEVTVRNNSTAAVNPWTATWTMPAGATINSGWNATVTQSGTTVTATPPSWGGTSLAAGASVTIGFVSSGTPGPTGVRLNNAACGA